jgi:hypothetical protein
MTSASNTPGRPTIANVDRQPKVSLLQPAMKLPAVLAAGNASVDEVTVPASLPHVAR